MSIEPYEVKKGGKPPREPYYEVVLKSYRGARRYWYLVKRAIPEGMDVDETITSVIEDDFDPEVWYVDDIRESTS